MATNPSLAELKARLDDFDRRLARARAGGALSAEHHAQAESIGAAAQALRAKIAAAPASALETVRRDLDEDWRILAHALERWERDVDTRFRRLPPEKA